MVSVYDSEKILKDFQNWCVDEQGKRELISPKHEAFFHSIGYESATLKKGTFYHTLSEEEYVNFALRYL